MDNNFNNGNPQSTTWTDPITGEIYPSGNPHADIQSSRVVGSAPNQNQAAQSVYNDPLPPGAMPRQVQRAPQPQVQPMPQLLPMQPVQQVQPAYQATGITKFCEHCGSVLVQAAVICPTCGCQVAPIRQQEPIQNIQQIQQYPVQNMQQYPAQQPIQPMQVIINNNINQGHPKDKVVALLLCIFLGVYGAHRFYEGRIGTAILWMFTFGMFGIGWLVDVIRIACAPNPYYIK